jgi:hypothetical protein
MDKQKLSQQVVALADMLLAAQVALADLRREMCDAARPAPRKRPTTDADAARVRRDAALRAESLRAAKREAASRSAKREAAERAAERAAKREAARAAKREESHDRAQQRLAAARAKRAATPRRAAPRPVMPGEVQNLSAWAERNGVTFAPNE